MRESKMRKLFLTIASLAIMMVSVMAVKLDSKAYSYYEYTIYQNSSNGSISHTYSEVITGSGGGDVYAVYVYKPGVYRFYSYNKSSGDPYVMIFTDRSRAISTVQSGCQSNHSYAIGYNDDGNGNLNYNLYTYLNAGWNYVVYTRYSTSSSARYYIGVSRVTPGTITLNKQSGTGGTNALYGGRSGCSVSNPGSVRYSDSSLGTAISKITIPTRSGYEFLGYYTGTNGSGTQVIKADGTINVSALSNAFSNNGTVYAHWKALNTNINFDAKKAATSTLSKNTGVAGTTSVVAGLNKSLPTITVPTMDGYTFEGYYYNGTQYYNASGVGTQIWTNVAYAGQTLTFTAKWTPKVYQVTLNANGGIGGATVAETFENDLAINLPKPHRNGYNFKGYYYYANSSDTVGVQYYDEDMSPSTEVGGIWRIASEGVSLKAKWDPCTYHISLYSNDDVYGVNGGSGFVALKTPVTYGTLILPTAEEYGMTREHFDFIGWSLYDGQDWAMYYPNTVYKTGLANVEDETITLYAAWQIKDNYTIAYSANGGTKSPVNATVFKGDSYTIASEVPVMEGYSFAGWDISPSGNSATKYMPGDSFTVTANTTFYACWERNKSVTYNANGGEFTSVLPTIYPAAGSVVTVETKEENMPVRTGYTFLGWSTNKNANTAMYSAAGTKTFNMPLVSPTDVILYAIWDIDKYPVTYNSECDESTFTYVDKVNQVNYLQDYSIKLKVNPAAVDVTNLAVIVDETVMKNPDPEELDGGYYLYTYLIKEPVGDQSIDIMGLEVKEYRITYFLNGGSFAEEPIASYSYDADNAQVFGGSATRNGYTFGGWYSNSGLTGASLTGVPAASTGDKVYYAKWSANSYTVTFDENGMKTSGTITGTAPENISAVYDTSFTIPSAGDLQYTLGGTEIAFLGWYVEETVTNGDETTTVIHKYRVGESVRNLVPNGNVVLHADWDIPTYDISYDLNGGTGSGFSNEFVLGGSSITIPSTIPAKTGFIFDGWNDGSNNYAAGDTVAEIAKNYEFTAKWREVKYNVEFKVKVPENGHVMKGDDSYDAGEEFVVSKLENVKYSDLVSFPTMTYPLRDARIEAAQVALSQREEEFNTVLNGKTVQDYYDEDQTAQGVVTAKLTAWNALKDGVTELETAFDDYKASDDHALANHEEDGNCDDATCQANYEAWQDALTECATAEGEYNDACTAQGLTASAYAAVLLAQTNFNDAQAALTAAQTASIDTVFIGWAASASATEPDFANGQKASRLTLADGFTKTYYAVFAAEEVKYISYDGNGFALDLPSVAIADGKVTLATPAVREHYTFQGWEIEGRDDLAAAGTQLTGITENITAIANWKPDTYKVLFEANAEGVTGEMAAMTVNYDATVALTSNLFVKDFYSFMGWATSADGAVVYRNGQNIFNANAGEDITLYAVWEITNPIIITFNANGGDGAPEAIAVPAGAPADFAEGMPTYEGYTFIGWADAENAENATKVYYALVGDDAVTYYNDAAHTEAATLDTSQATTLYAMWNARERYTVEYQAAEGASGSVPVDMNYHYPDNGLAINFSLQPAKAGYSFVGWKNKDHIYKEEDGTEIVLTSDMADDDNVVRFLEVLVPNKYRVCFYEDGECINEGGMEFTYGEAQPDISAIEATLASDHAAYTFGGWAIIEGGPVVYEGNGDLTDLTVQKDGLVNLYAVFTAKKSTITFDNGDDAEKEQVVATYGSWVPAVSFNPPTKVSEEEGTTHVFGGYYSQPNGQGKQYYDGALNSTDRFDQTEDITLYAKWIPKDFKLIYMYQGMILWNSDIKYGDNVVVPASNILPNGTVVAGVSKLYGWSKTGDTGTEEDPVTVYKPNQSVNVWNKGSDVILYPIITKDAKFTIAYNSNGGTGFPTETKNREFDDEESYTISYSVIPQKTDYDFLGWSEDPNATEPTYTQDGNNTIKVKYDMTLYAIYRNSTYTVSYETNAADAVLVGDAQKAYEIERGSVNFHHAGEIYTREGYSLQGWSSSKSSDNMVMYDLGDTITSNLTTNDSLKLYTVWKADEVTVVYDTVGGNTLDSSIVNFGEKYGNLKTPVKDGYSFEGWYRTYNEETNEYSDLIEAASIVTEKQAHTVYAKWSEDVFEIKYHSNYGEDEIVSKNYKVTEDLVLCGMDEFSRANHTLVGYAMSPNGPVVYNPEQALGERWTVKGTCTNLYCIWDVSTFIDLEAEQSYIYYIANGAVTGQAPAYGVYDKDKLAVIADNTGNMGKYGYVFDGWNTESDGSGTAYVAGQEISISESMVLFAQWRAGEFKISLTGDEGIVPNSLKIAPEKENYTYEDVITVTAMVKPGYEFARFVSNNEKVVQSSDGNAQGNGIYSYEFVVPGEGVEIVAATKSVLTLEANGGVFENESGTLNMVWENGTVLEDVELETPVRDGGFYFIGWFEDAACTKEVSMDDTIWGAKVLYAGWGYQAGSGELKIMALDDVVYTGAKVTPSLLVKDGNKVLTAGVDYTVSFSNNVNVNKGGKFVDTNALILGNGSVDASQLDKKLPYVTVKGKGNYTSTVSMNFNILPKNLEDIDGEDSGLSLYYDQCLAASKKALKPAVVLSYTEGSNKTKVLKAKKDYTVGYKNADGQVLDQIPANATGDYTLVITAVANGNYSGSFERDFMVTSETTSLANAKVTVKAATLVKDMTADQLAITVKVGKATLVAGQDYVATFADGIPTTPGTYSVVIEPAEGSSYSDMKAAKVKLGARKINKAVISMVSGVKYTGESYGNGIKSVAENNVLLEEGIDYTTKYTGGTKAGTVKVVIAGCGIYNGSSVTKSYTIAPYDLEADTDQLVTVISPAEPSMFSQAGATAEFTVKFAGKTLVEGKDYKVTYKNNKKVTSEYALTKPSIIINGIGNYKGAISGGSYVIVRKSLSDETVRANASNIVYKQNALLNANFTVVETDSNMKLVAGRDFDKDNVIYTYNGEEITKCPEIGSIVDVTIKGIENYKDSYTFSVNVVGESIKKQKVAKIKKVYTGSAVELTEEDIVIKYKIKTAQAAEYFNADGTYCLVDSQTPSTALKVGDTVLLKAGRDFDLENAVYTNNVNSGKAKAELVGMGYFGDSLVVQYTINKKSFAWFK